jgi:uncharacterized protein (PEP-CTERM system associated)
MTTAPARGWAAALIAVGLSAGAAQAQTTIPTPPPPATPPGWVVTPSVGVAELWDDNVALTSEAVGELGDYLTAVSPGLNLGYRGRRSTLGILYSGTYEFYRNLSQFDAADHRARGDFQRRLSERITLFARDAFSRSPTTAILSPSTGLVVLRRRTTRVNDFRGGVEFMPSATSTFTAAYTSQWVELARDEQVAPLLRGGRSDGADVSFDKQVATRVSVGAKYLGTRAVVADGGESFDVQNALATLELALTQALTLNAGAGYSWQRTGVGLETEAAPAYEAHLLFQQQRSRWELSYVRSFQASFGFGGTVQNEELAGSLSAPLGRYFEIGANGAVRDNDSLDLRNLSLRSRSLAGRFAYLPVRWLRIEVFSQYFHQDTQVGGGQISRSQTGLRISTQHPVRLR